VGHLLSDECLDFLNFQDSYNRSLHADWLRIVVRIPQLREGKRTQTKENEQEKRQEASQRGRKEQKGTS
jgi:hypothetical protein